MSVCIDHIIVPVNDARESVDFYVEILGFSDEGKDGPFSVVRVDAHFTLQFAPYGTKGGEHYAFGMSRDTFDETFARLRAKGVPFGDAFDTVGTNRGPGHESGARGMGKTIYFFDPNKHLLEIRTYGA
jgi:catechol 2,3-dioxygenase-like lactoylglutathione lyase family enzyme